MYLQEPTHCKLTKLKKIITFMTSISETHTSDTQTIEPSPSELPSNKSRQMVSHGQNFNKDPK